MTGKGQLKVVRGRLIRRLLRAAEKANTANGF